MKLLIVYNKFSRNNKERQFNKIKDTLNSRYETSVFLSCGVKSITNHIIENGQNFDIICAIGGDGTVNEAVNGIMKLEKKPKLAIIPFGTCNDISKSLRIRNVKKALKMINNNDFHNHNVFKINDNYFVYGLAAGGVSNISYKVDRKQKKILGKNAYYLNTLKAIFEKNPKIHLEIDDGKRIIEDTFYLMLALNTRYLAGFRVVGTQKYYNDSKLHIALFKKQHRLQGFLAFTFFILFGKTNKNMIIFDADKLTIACEEGTIFNTDGEELKAPTTKLEISCITNELIILGKEKKKEN